MSKQSKTVGSVRRLPALTINHNIHPDAVRGFSNATTHDTSNGNSRNTKVMPQPSPQPLLQSPRPSLQSPQPWLQSPQQSLQSPPPSLQSPPPSPSPSPEVPPASFRQSMSRPSRRGAPRTIVESSDSELEPLEEAESNIDCDGARDPDPLRVELRQQRLDIVRAAPAWNENAQSAYGQHAGPLQLAKRHAARREEEDRRGEVVDSTEHRALVGQQQDDPRTNQQAMEKRRPEEGSGRCLSGPVGLKLLVHSCLSVWSWVLWTVKLLLALLFVGLVVSFVLFCVKAPTSKPPLPSSVAGASASYFIDARSKVSRAKELAVELNMNVKAEIEMRFDAICCDGDIGRGTLEGDLLTNTANLAAELKAGIADGKYSRKLIRATSSANDSIVSAQIGAQRRLTGLDNLSRLVEITHRDTSQKLQELDSQMKSRRMKMSFFRSAENLMLETLIKQTHLLSSMAQKLASAQDYERLHRKRSELMRRELEQIASSLPPFDSTAAAARLLELRRSFIKVWLAADLSTLDALELWVREVYPRLGT